MESRTTTAASLEGGIQALPFSITYNGETFTSIAAIQQNIESLPPDARYEAQKEVLNDMWEKKRALEASAETFLAWMRQEGSYARTETDATFEKRNKLAFGKIDDKTKPRNRLMELTRKIASLWGNDPMAVGWLTTQPGNPTFLGAVKGIAVKMPFNVAIHLINAQAVLRTTQPKRGVNNVRHIMTGDINNASMVKDASSVTIAEKDYLRLGWRMGAYGGLVSADEGKLTVGHSDVKAQVAGATMSEDDDGTL